MPTQEKYNIDIEYYLKKKKSLIDDYLSNLFEKDKDYSSPKELWDAVKYSLLNGGKRIRGVLCLATCESTSGNNSNFYNDCLIVASSVEMIHAMSLIHDDLPSMDNDDLRRGKPSCHKAFGEATAIIAGDGMLTLSVNLITEKTKYISDLQKLELIRILTRAFTFGLVPGQILDFLATNKKIDLEQIKNIAILKTANLIKASVLCGAVTADIDFKNKPVLFESIDKFGTKVGIAFQIIDDILDVTSDTKTLGKTSGKDKKSNKPTFPSILGIEDSKIMAENLISEAKIELKKNLQNPNLLFSIADYIVKRIY